jgi:tRNA-dihydrouridine synthase C
MNPIPFPKFILAPMEGITDAPMREVLVGECGADFAVTEFLRVSHLPAPRHVIAAKWGRPELQRVPVALQILGEHAFYEVTAHAI